MKNLLLIIFSLTVVSTLCGQTMMNSDPVAVFKEIKLLKNVKTNGSRSWVTKVDLVYNKKTKKIDSTFHDFSRADLAFMETLIEFTKKTDARGIMWKKSGAHTVLYKGLLFVIPPNVEKQAYYFYFNPRDPQSPVRINYLRKAKVVYRGKVIEYEDEEPNAGWNVVEKPTETMRSCFSGKKLLEHR